MRKEDRKSKDSSISIKEITLIGLLIAILFVQEELLSFLPNIQLTVFLILLYSKKLGFIKSSIIVFVHTLLDNIIFGSFGIQTPFMFIGWMIIPIFTELFLKRIENPIILAFFSVIFSLLYSWIFVIPSCILLKMEFIPYIIADFSFEILLSLSSFISTLILYKPLSKVFDKGLSRK